MIFADGDMEAFPKELQHYLDALKGFDIAIASKRVLGAHVTASVHFVTSCPSASTRFFISCFLSR